MMFITPIPPTSSEIAATSPSSVVNTPLVDCEADRIVPWLMTLNPGLLAVVPSCCSRIDVTSFCAAVSSLWDVLDGDRADRPVSGEHVLDGGDRRERDVV